MEEVLVNKVAESGIITLNLETFLPDEQQLMVFDLKPFLFKEMILREKDFRLALAEHNWEQYAGKQVSITCSVDAIIPMWAFMLVTAQLQPFAAIVVSGDRQALQEQLTLANISKLDITPYIGQRVVIKGCDDKAMPQSAYIAISQLLRPQVKSLMYGEPCSTVPVYKKK